jgi:hypothetical protein
MSAKDQGAFRGEAETTWFRCKESARGKPIRAPRVGRRLKGTSRYGVNLRLSSTGEIGVAFVLSEMLR